MSTVCRAPPAAPRRDSRRGTDPAPAPEQIVEDDNPPEVALNRLPVDGVERRADHQVVQAEGERGEVKRHNDMSALCSGLTSSTTLI